MPILSTTIPAHGDGVSKLGPASLVIRAGLNPHHPAIDRHARSLVAEADFLGLLLCSRYEVMPDTAGRICWHIDCGRKREPTHQSCQAL